MGNRYRKLSIVLLAVGMIVSLAACGKAEQRNPSDRESTSNIAVEPAQTDNAQNDSGSDEAVEQTVIRLAFGDTVMTAALDDSETSQDFIKMLPLTFTMNRYADREYYAALGELPEFSVFNNVEITGVNTSVLSDEEQAVLYQQARYCQAMTEADTETMREITSPDMIFTHMSGRQQTREEYFADIADGNLQYFKIGIENPVVSINGNYASVSYTSVLNANAYGARGTYRIDGTHWYEKQNENWIACNTPEQ